MYGWRGNACDVDVSSCGGIEQLQKLCRTGAQGWVMIEALEGMRSDAWVLDGKSGGKDEAACLLQRVNSLHACGEDVE